uniref:Transmembrane protein n=1 Tax=Macrostomum lignano TaxID=282301 RepID=A0A1I8I3P5_9PLAT
LLNERLSMLVEVFGAEIAAEPFAELPDSFPLAFFVVVTSRGSRSRVLIAARRGRLIALRRFDWRNRTLPPSSREPSSWVTVSSSSSATSFRVDQLFVEAHLRLPCRHFKAPVIHFGVLGFPALVAAYKVVTDSSWLRLNEQNRARSAFSNASRTLGKFLARTLAISTTAAGWVTLALANRKNSSLRSEFVTTAGLQYQTSLTPVLPQRETEKYAGLHMVLEETDRELTQQRQSVDLFDRKLDSIVGSAARNSFRKFVVNSPIDFSLQRSHGFPTLLDELRVPLDVVFKSNSGGLGCLSQHPVSVRHAESEHVSCHLLVNRTEVQGSILAELHNTVRIHQHVDSVSAWEPDAEQVAEFPATTEPVGASSTGCIRRSQRSRLHLDFVRQLSISCRSAAETRRSIGQVGSGHPVQVRRRRSRWRRRQQSAFERGLRAGQIRRRCRGASVQQVVSVQLILVFAFLTALTSSNLCLGGGSRRGDLLIGRVVELHRRVGCARRRDRRSGGSRRGEALVTATAASRKALSLFNYSLPIVLELLLLLRRRLRRRRTIADIAVHPRLIVIRLSGRIHGVHNSLGENGGRWLASRQEVASGQHGVQLGELVPDIDEDASAREARHRCCLLLLLGVPRRRTRRRSQEQPHLGEVFFQESVQKLQMRLLGSERASGTAAASVAACATVGKILYSLGNQRERATRSGVGQLVAQAEKRRAEDRRADEAQEEAGAYQSIAELLPARLCQSLAHQSEQPRHLRWQKLCRSSNPQPEQLHQGQQVALARSQLVGAERSLRIDFVGQADAGVSRRKNSTAFVATLFPRNIDASEVPPTLLVFTSDMHRSTRRFSALPMA